MYFTSSLTSGESFVVVFEKVVEDVSVICCVVVVVVVGVVVVVVVVSSARSFRTNKNKSYVVQIN
jgi:hypothetical protein